MAEAPGLTAFDRSLDRLSDEELLRELGEASLDDLEGVYATRSLEDLRKLGERVFRRLSPAAWQLLCGSEDADTEDRKHVVDAFGIGKDAVRIALKAALVGLGIADNVAAIVVVLVVRFIVQPTWKATCDVWKEKLPK